MLLLSTDADQNNYLKTPAQLAEQLAEERALPHALDPTPLNVHLETSFFAKIGFDIAENEPSTIY